MAWEIEVKVRVRDLDSTKKRLEEVCGDAESNYFKRDVYYSADPAAIFPITSFRLRENEGNYVVTRKEKNIQQGIEQSREIEFSPDDPGAFHDFALSLGYSVAVEKQKKGWGYRIGNWLFELSDVVGLGWFLEIEKILPDDSTEQEIQDAKAAIRDWMDKLELSASDIEDRPYTLMLYEKSNTD